jgi:hypothetical protein
MSIEEYMSIKMKKSDLLIAAAIVAGLLGGVLAGLASCQNGLTSDIDSLALPPTLPYARITSQSGESYRFSLAWKMEDVILSPQAVYDEAETAAAISNAYNKWEEFERKIYALPHAVPADPDAPPDLAVWELGGGAAGYVLKNDGTKEIVINRCWPKSLIGTTLTRAAWLASREERQKEFRQVVSDIKAMMASIEKSPLREFLVNDEPLLAKLHDRMAEFIAFPTDAETFSYEDRPRWMAPGDLDTSGGQIISKWDTARTSPLFEYFFGYVPQDTDYVNSKGQLSFPE